MPPDDPIIVDEPPSDPKIDTGRMRALLAEQEERLVQRFGHLLSEYDRTQKKRLYNILKWIASQFQ